MPNNNSSKRNAQGGGSIRQRKNGTWEARYTIGRNSGTGKQIQKSVYGKTQKEVRQKLTQATATLDEGTYTDTSRLTIGAWLDIWLADYVSNNAVKPETIRSYSDQCRRYIKPSLGAVKLSALTPHAVQKFYNGLQKKEDSKNGLSPKSIKGVHGVLHQALKQAVKLGYIKFNPTDACILPRVEKKEIKPLDEQGIAAFLDAIKGHQYETIYTVTLFTGLRQGEALGLCWDCVDFVKGTILVGRQLQKGKERGAVHKLVPVKNDKSRLITPAPFVMSLLRRHKKESDKMKLKAGPAWIDSTFVFTNELGEHLKTVTVYKNFKRVVETIGLGNTRYHDLRHTYAVASIQAGDDVKTVQENMGHHTAAFTLDVYGHVTDKMKKDSAKRMEAFIKGIKNL